MKYFTLFFFIFSQLYAQIPNPGFENWTLYGSYYDPDNWCTFNSMTTGPNIYTTTKGTPGYSGNFYLVLETKTFTPSGFLRGKAISGQYMPSGNIKGFASTSRPSFLNGVWKYSDPAANPAEVSVFLSKWNSTTNRRDTICYYKANVSGTVTSWTNFNIDISSGYKSSANPDSCMIGLWSSANSIGSYLHVDDLSFSGNVNVFENGFRENSFSVYPNPSRDYLYFIIDGKDEEAVISITDKLGKEILRSRDRKIYIGNLVNDSYFITVISKSNISRKVFVKTD